MYRNVQKIFDHQNSLICNEQYFLALITNQSLNRFSQKLIGSWFLFDFGVRFINKNKIRFILLRYNFYNLWVHELNTKLYFNIKKQSYIVIVLLETANSKFVIKSWIFKNKSDSKYYLKITTDNCIVYAFVDANLY